MADILAAVLLHDKRLPEQAIGESLEIGEASNVPFRSNSTHLKSCHFQLVV